MAATCLLICLDNSEYLRNGDYNPTRYAAQLEAAVLIAETYVRKNSVNSIGILSMAGQRVEMQLNPVMGIGNIMSALLKIKIDGELDLLRGIQTAQLALKHRANKDFAQRIICFVGSPVTAREQNLITLAKSLKKNNVAIDIISFGDVDVNSEKLGNFFAAVNNNNSSSFLENKNGSLRSLISTVHQLPFFQFSESRNMDPDSDIGGSSSWPNEFDVDPTIDPELFLALRLSWDEENARNQQQENSASNETANANANIEEVNAELNQTEQSLISTENPSESIPTISINENNSSQNEEVSGIIEETDLIRAFDEANSSNNTTDGNKFDELYLNDLNDPNIQEAIRLSELEANSNMEDLEKKEEEEEISKKNKENEKDL